MKIGVIITTNEVEKAWNAFRYMNTALEMDHEVTTFLMSAGVECEFMDHEFFNVSDQIDRFIENKGKIFSCSTCLQFRKLHDRAQRTEITTMLKAVKMTEENDQVLTF